tara:strand:+ start:1411 stop:1614 length:204 start_codon:yes stop_codon:yes gene_type:complete
LTVLVISQVVAPFLRVETKNIPKFAEAAMKFLYYFVAWWSEVYVLWSKPFFWDHREMLNKEMYDEMG